MQFTLSAVLVSLLSLTQALPVLPLVNIKARSADDEITFEFATIDLTTSILGGFLLANGSLKGDTVLDIIRGAAGLDATQVTPTDPKGEPKHQPVPDTKLASDLGILNATDVLNIKGTV